MTNWRELSARASLASHRLIGWIYWDPDAIARYTALGVPNGLGYYVASRAAPLASSGNDAVVAAFYSIRKEFIDLCLDTARKHTTFEDAYRVRNEAVARGLREYAPEIVAPLGEMATNLWDAADSLPLARRPLYAAHRSWPRCQDDAALSAWLAVNCIREWRGDT
ncbi:MAG: helix-turn-helix domain-containing protein, partial [Ilumatobacteraceae bacterium]